MSENHDTDRNEGVAANADQVPGAGASASDSYGGAVSDDPTPVTEPGTQNEPVQDMHDTTDEDKIIGIVAQTRQDVGGKGERRIAEVLRQRFRETGVDVADDRIAALVAEVARG
ncbi:hypothetical protein [Microbacterium sp. A1-JK]|uniref:hypothetical protein n=1 Tax=Microbacterium sp. A1-JK TaxID=3177516 RepID=UPI00388BB43F